MDRKFLDVHSSSCIREAAKKDYFLNGSAIRAGGGGLHLRKKDSYIFFPFKDKKYFTLDNLSTYGHITLKLFGRYFYWFVTKFAKKYGSKKYKNGGDKNCQNPLPAILRLMALPL